MTMPDEERSIAQLMGDSIAELAKLFQNEVDLARAEMREKAAMIAGAARLIAVGSILMIPALVVILLAIAAGLAQLGLSTLAAYACTGLGAAVLAGALILVGLSRLKPDALRPSATLDEIRRDGLLAKEILR